MKFSKTIIGNNETKEYLRRIIETDNILHSYLFLGKSGIGKKLIAKEFAKYVLCIGDKTNDCKCKSCICFDGNNNPDFEIINEEEETIKVDTIRVLNSKVVEKPIISNRKVYIINDSDKMRREAQNSLLKTLEEPPEFVTIILIASNENMLLNTIKSRCMKFYFNGLTDEEIKKYAKENVGYDKISNTLLKTINGSIGKIYQYKENLDIYDKIDLLIQNLENKDIIWTLSNAKFIYDKEKIKDYLEYFTVALYEKANDNKKYLNCIKHIPKCIEKLSANGNFDMNVDNLILKIWEELHENSYRD